MASDKCMVAWVPVNELRSLMAQGAGAGSAEATQTQGQRTPRTPGRRQEQRRGAPGQQQDFVPKIEGFQLIGDSMLSRIAASKGKGKPKFNHYLKAKQIGLSVHGQTTGQLLKLLKDKKCPKFGPKLLVTIGTNNILKNVPTQATKESLNKVLERLTAQAQKVLITTVPPIPKISDFPNQSQLWHEINDYITGLQTTETLSVVDITQNFMDGTSVNNIMFASDQVHFSKEGMDAYLAAVKEHMR